MGFQGDNYGENREVSIACNRRTFLKGIFATALPAIAGTCRSTSTTGPESREIIDTHTHFYNPERPQGVPWPREGSSLYRPVFPDEFKKKTEPLGVTGTVVVEASPWPEDNWWLLRMARRDPFLVGVVGHLDPGTDLFSRQFDRLTRDPLFRGIRISGKTLRGGLGNDQFINDLNSLAAADRSLDLLVGPGDMDGILRLAETVPDLRIVINHLPNSLFPDPGSRPAGDDQFRSIAAQKKVHLKVSGVLQKRNGNVPVDPDVYRSRLDDLWELFGKRRVIYGSNWPVSSLRAPYEDVLTVISQYVHNRGADAADQFFWKNSKTVYRYPAG